MPPAQGSGLYSSLADKKDKPVCSLLVQNSLLKFYTILSLVCRAIYLRCFSNSSIHTQPNQGYLHISVSPSPMVLSIASHLILTLWNTLMLSANAACKKLWGHLSTKQGRSITNHLLLSEPSLPAKLRPPLPRNKRWTSSSTMLLPIQMTA